jgi:SAM-dependent methyltransferase
VQPHARGKRILDLGVGGGRSTEFLLELSEDYIGVDYTKELLGACRQRHPHVDVREADARDLSDFADESFSLIVFSFNGVDSIAHEDRHLVWQEVYRVLRPGGLFWFSTHNLDGPVQKAPRFSLPQLRLSKNPFRSAVRALRYVRLATVQAAHRFSYKRHDEFGDDYCMVNTGAHDYGLMIHHIRLSKQTRQLVEVGFSPEMQVFDCNTGDAVSPGQDTSDVGWFHIVAHKPAG